MMTISKFTSLATSLLRSRSVHPTNCLLDISSWICLPSQVKIRSRTQFLSQKSSSFYIVHLNKWHFNLTVAKIIHDYSSIKPTQPPLSLVNSTYSMCLKFIYLFQCPFPFSDHCHHHLSPLLLQQYYLTSLFSAKLRRAKRQRYKPEKSIPTLKTLNGSQAITHNLQDFDLVSIILSSLILRCSPLLLVQSRHTGHLTCCLSPPVLPPLFCLANILGLCLNVTSRKDFSSSPILFFLIESAAYIFL